MARVIKSNTFDDGQFPMPPDPRQHGAGADHNAHMEPAELQHAASELQQIVGMITGMRPAVQELAETLRHDARAEGYREGTDRAHAEVQSQLILALEALTSAQRERHRIAAEHEGALAQLALDIARKVIGAHLDADPTLVSRIVQHAIQELEPSTSLEVHVHADDLPAVEAGRRELERLVQGGGRVEIVPDERVDRGGVMLVSPVGDVDARIETKLSVLETAFAAQRRALTD